ncbi:hypothetical protein PoB_007145100 [Plakobranchus ocellatus]|uniref:Uncharacterized protein n=1 Tax=Plakobranchus ocellatus TaxID=259542 RepID=A0AAV4DL92_9GAST|nr:hypothetical protein PoB_007145100 [Plakobranchus ocellatus]
MDLTRPFELWHPWTRLGLSDRTLMPPLGQSVGGGRKVDRTRDITEPADSRARSQALRHTTSPKDTYFRLTVHSHQKCWTPVC